MSGKLQPGEFVYTEERCREAGQNWGLSMVEEEVEKRHHGRLVEIIGMSDALLIDTVSAFSFPYLITGPGSRCFLQSKEWERYVVLRVACEQKRLWEFPIELSIAALQVILHSLYEWQPNLRVLFHLPRPCFNDGVSFEDPQLTANVGFYHEYGEQLYRAASQRFPRVSLIRCGGERADPLHYNFPFPFHYDENYMNRLRSEIEQLLD